MKSIIAAAALVALFAPTAIQAQDTGHYDDVSGNPEYDGNHEGDWQPLCTTFGICDDPHGGSGEEGGLLDGITGAWDKAKEWYDEQKAAAQAERERRAEAERQRLADLEARILDPYVREAILAYRQQEGGLWQQAHRVLGDNMRGPFSGSAEDDEGMINYSGTRANGYIWGNYTIQYFDPAPSDPSTDNGAFAGSVTRFGRVTGAYVNSGTGEQGNFTGSMSPSLDTIFQGGFNCTQNCSGD